MYVFIVTMTVVNPYWLLHNLFIECVFVREISGAEEEVSYIPFGVRNVLPSNLGSDGYRLEVTWIPSLIMPLVKMLTTSKLTH